MSASRPPRRTSSGPQRQPPPALRGAAQRGEVRQREEGERVQQHVGGKLEERAELHGAIAFRVEAGRRVEYSRLRAEPPNRLLRGTSSVCTRRSRLHRKKKKHRSTA